MIISSSALAASISQTAAKIQTLLPAGFTAALTAGRGLPHAADALAGHLDALHHAALNAITAGTDPAADPEVQRLAIYRALADSGLRQSADRRAGDDIRTAIADYADSIITSWGDAIADDLATLHTAAAELPVDALDKADHTALRRTGQLNLWADASNATDRADHVTRGVDAILTALAVNHSSHHRVLLLAPDMELTQFSAVQGRERSAWAVARTGCPLRLASLADFTAAIGRITAEQQELHRKIEAEQLDAKRSARGAIPQWQRIG